MESCEFYCNVIVPVADILKQPLFVVLRLLAGVLVDNNNNPLFNVDNVDVVDIH
jgi:hypothetical protein